MIWIKYEKWRRDESESGMWNKDVEITKLLLKSALDVYMQVMNITSWPEIP